MTTIGLMILINGGGFFIIGGLLHWWFYVHKKDEAETWKHQPKRWQSRKKMLEKLPLVILNAIIINTFIGMAFHFTFYHEGITRVFWSPTEYGVPYLILSTLALPFWYHFTLYYWHRYMHTNMWLYKKIHHVHHKYKDPVWLDGLYEHPVEAVYGGLVLTVPLYLWPINGFGFFLYLGMVGLHEIIDHAGVNLNIPFLSKSRAHDDHHLRFNYYYGQLLSLLDDHHDTVYYGKEKKKPAAGAAANSDIEQATPA